MNKDWNVKKLGVVSDLINGRAYKKKELLSEGKYPVLRVGNFFTSKHWYYSDLELPENKYCDNGDLLYAWSASFGPRVWNGEKVIYHYHIWKVVPNLELVTRDYLYWFLEWDTEKIKDEQGTGTTMIHVSKGSMEKRDIPLPPIIEQQRIVTLIDEAFETIDKAKENTEKNLQSAREIFQSYLQNVFANPGEDWEEKKLSSITLKVGSGATPKGGSASYKESGLSLIRSQNVYDEGFRMKNLAYIDDMQAKKLDNVTILKEDVLLNITGASITRCCVVPDEILPARVNQHVSIIRPNELICSSFLYYSLISKHNKDKLIRIARAGGSTREALTKDTLLSFSIYVPKKISEQQNIVDKLAVVSMETKKLQEIYRKKLTNLDELKKSILQKAFNDEL